MARAVSAEMHSGFIALRTRFSMDMIRRYAGMQLTDAEEADVARIDTIWPECVARSGGPYLFGEWSVADCFYTPVVSRFETYGFATSEPATDYADAVRRHPHYVEWLESAKAEPLTIQIDQLAGV